MASKKDQTQALHDFITDSAEKPTAAGEAPAGEYLPAGPEGGRISTQGVGLRESELNELRALADTLGLRTNAIMRLAIRYFLIGVHEGRIEPRNLVETKTQTVTKPKY